MYFTDARSPEPYRQYYRWVMLLLLWMLYAAWGIIFRSTGPLVTPIIRDLDISYTQMGFILGAWPITYILISLIGGTVLDRWGVRRSIFAGAIVIGLSAVFRFFPSGFTGMFFAVALFGVGGPMISIGGPKAISLWFRGKDRGTAIGIYMTGSISGGLLSLAITNSIIMPATGHSWRMTFVVYGVFMLLIAGIWWLLARDKKPANSEETSGIAEVFSGIIKIRNVRNLVIMGFCAFAILHGFANWLPKILETQGLSPSEAGFAASIPLAAGIPSILLIPRLVPVYLRGRFIAFFAFLTGSTLLVVPVGTETVLYVSLVIFGIGCSAFLPFLTLMLLDTKEVDLKYMGTAVGIFFCFSEIGGVTGPLLMGAFVDITGTFRSGSYVLSGFSLIILIMAFFLKSESDPTETWQGPDNDLKDSPR